MYKYNIPPKSPVVPGIGGGVRSESAERYQELQFPGIRGSILEIMTSFAAVIVWNILSQTNDGENLFGTLNSDSSRYHR